MGNGYDLNDDMCQACSSYTGEVGNQTTCPAHSWGMGTASVTTRPTQACPCPHCDCRIMNSCFDEHRAKHGESSESVIACTNVENGNSEGRIFDWMNDQACCLKALEEC